MEEEETSATPTKRRPDGLPAWMGSMAGEIVIADDFDAYDDQIIKDFEASIRA